MDPGPYRADPAESCRRGDTAHASVGYRAEISLPSPRRSFRRWPPGTCPPVQADRSADPVGRASRCCTSKPAAMREACRPAASGTPTGAAESPLPLPTGLHVVRAVTARHRHRLGAGSTRRTWLVAELLGDGAGEGLGRLSLTSTTVDPVDVTRASSEAYTVARSGCATAAAVMASALAPTTRHAQPSRCGRACPTRGCRRADR